MWYDVSHKGLLLGIIDQFAIVAMVIVQTYHVHLKSCPESSPTILNNKHTYTSLVVRELLWQSDIYINLINVARLHMKQPFRGG